MTVYQPSPSLGSTTLAKHALTSAFQSPPPATPYSYHAFMQLPDRDREIVRLVGQFGQLTTRQVKALVYPGKLHNPQQRTLNRLVSNRLLATVNERLAGGVRGGNQMHVYQLGSQGRKLFTDTRRGHSIVIDHHALAIADVYVALSQAHQAGTIKLLNWATEPDCHIDVGGTYLKPDLYIDVVTQQDGQWVRHPRWIEVDMGTERRKQIMEKLTAYKAAYSSRDSYPLPIYPTVLFLATRDERATELRYWMSYQKDMPAIFDVGLIQDALQILQR